MGLDRAAVGSVRLNFGEGLVGLAAEQREPVAIERAREHPRYRYFPETQEEQFESLMAAPLIVSGVPIGVIVVQTRNPRHFERSDIDLLQTCAQLLAPVVLNARLIDLVARTDEERHRVVSELSTHGIPLSGPGRGRRPERNVELRGSPSSPGVGIGPIYRLEDPVDLNRVSYEPRSDPNEEREFLLAAIAEARRELDDLRLTMGDRFGPDFAAVFNTHIQILEDKSLVERLEAEVSAQGNAVTALRSVLDAYRVIFEGIENPYFRERGSDVEDVGRRVAAHLMNVTQVEVSLPENAVVVVPTIQPGYFAVFDPDRISAVVAEHGGPTSHGAIFARSLEIPALTGVSGLLAAARTGEMAIVDGSSGRMYLSPEESLDQEYRRAQQRHDVVVEHLDALRERPAETRDGRRIRLTANVGLMHDLRLVDRHGAEGVGLFRTELLALAHRSLPDEEEQEQLYERVARRMAPRPVTIRTLDLGGDKALPQIGVTLHEENPQLGLRSIRLSLADRAAFVDQLCAILRASSHANVRILLPMVSGIEELREARELLDAAKQRLTKRAVPFDENVPLGVMIEVPSAALCAEPLAEECDFFSIGTNDLTQYTLAVDRGNERVAHLYDPLHPAVLGLIDRAVRAANHARIPISVCGEMAGNPLAVPLLVGLGIGELSATASAVPIIKEIVRALDGGSVAEDARQALRSATPRQVHEIAARRLRDAGLFDHPDIGAWLKEMAEK